MRNRFLILLTGAVVVLAVLACTALFLNRPQRVTIDAPVPGEFANGGFPHTALERLLSRYVDNEGNIDFAGWHDNAGDRGMLDGYLAAVSAFSPAVTPERFPTRADELAYWMYAYNAYVIRSVLEHWPIASVTDVRAPIEAVTGLGFFYRQRFSFGGTSYSLYALENEVIRKSFEDARVHFVLYCASSSCPAIRPELPTGAALEARLIEATRAFIGDPANVSIDHDAKIVRLSAIFDMYRSDFLRDLVRRGIPAERGVIDYIISVAPESIRAELSATADYDVQYMEYDWAIAAQ